MILILNIVIKKILKLYKNNNNIYATCVIKI